jgi:hypothetical protein
MCHRVPSSGEVYIFQRGLGHEGGKRDVKIGGGWKRGKILLQSLAARR